MTILYDHQTFSLQQFGGVSRYFCDLIAHLPQGYQANFPIRLSENRYLSEAGYPVQSLPPTLPFRLKRRYYYFYNSRMANKELRRNAFDIFHPTYYDTYFLQQLRKPFILTVHDLIHEKYRNAFPRYDKTSEKKRLLADKAAHIIAVSQNTKKDLIELYGIHPDKVSVVYHGFQQRCQAAGQLFTNYILYVGERMGYKNFYPFMEAILPLLKAYPEIKVVCTGKAFHKKETALFTAWGIPNQLRHIYATDSELASLYQHALAFVYPSLYEGFGIPILEAFRNNCPVCLSQASCFPEIAGEAACYFNPSDNESIINSLRKVIENKAYADSLREKGKSRVELFSIPQMVSHTCKVYDIFG